MKTRFRVCLSIIVVGWGIGTTAMAQTSSEAAVDLSPKAGGPKWSMSLTPSLRYQFEADVGDGSASIFRYGAEVGVFVPITDQLSTAVSLKLEHSRYLWKDFEQVVPGVERPLRDAEQLIFTPTLLYEIDDRWSVTGGAIVISAAASGADVGDSLTYGGFVSAKYKFNDSFSLSGGVLGVSRLEESALVFPLVGFEWQINNQWRLETTGLGLRGSYKPSDSWVFFANAGYELREYRLDEDVQGGLGGGVMRDQAAVVAAGAAWKPTRSVTLELSGGVSFAGEMRFDDTNGDRVKKEDVDPAPFVGLSLKWEF